VQSLAVGIGFARFSLSKDKTIAKQAPFKISTCGLRQRNQHANPTGQVAIGKALATQRLAGSAAQSEGFPAAAMQSNGRARRGRVPSGRKRNKIAASGLRHRIGGKKCFPACLGCPGLAEVGVGRTMLKRDHRSLISNANSCAVHDPIVQMGLESIAIMRSSACKCYGRPLMHPLVGANGFLK
jgi:hypothetical protein